MMKRKIRNGISVLLSLGMVFSMSVCPGGITADAAAGAEVVSGGVSVKQAAASGGSSYGAVYEDDATGYLYKFYDDGTDDAGQKVEIVGYAGTGSAGSSEEGIAPCADTETEGDLVIPSTLDGNEVTSIGKEAFKGDKTITSVTISEGITSIGYQAFLNCTKLTKVSIPSTITEWKEENYENNAFKNCKGITELELAEGLTVLGQCAFYSCLGLQELKIPSSITTFKNKVFYNCTALKKLELPEGLKTMGYQAFGNSGLEEVTIPSTVEKWDTLHSSMVTAWVYDCSAFEGCKSLKKIVFTEGLKTLNQFSLGSVPQLKEIEVPGSVRDLSYAFKKASYLEKVTLNEGVTAIGVEAFDACTSLKEIRIPSTLSSKESTSFRGVSSMERVIYSPVRMASADISFENLKGIYILSDSEASARELSLSANTKVYCPQDSKTYQTYQSALAASGQENKLVAIPRTEAEAVGYEGVSDDQEHDAVTLSGIQEGDKVLYRLNRKGALLKDMPKVKDSGTYTVEIFVERAGETEPISAYSKLTVEAKVQENTTPSPSPSPSSTPGGDATPTPTPGGNATPTPTPGGNATPSPTPGGKATPTPKPPAPTLNVGSAVTAGKFKYKVTNATAGKLAVAVSAPTSKTAKSVAVPATVRVQGSTYQVTSIAANAFKNCKKLKSVTIGKNVTSIGKNAFSNAKALKKITVKTTKLKSVGKGAFKGIHKKAVIKVPKAKLKTYKKLFKGRGQKKTVKIKN